MKTRKSSTESNEGIIDKSKNNLKRKYQKKIKIKECSNGTSYCDSHNIGKRKSNFDVVTYSLNSHLFFDVYAKFDKNDKTRWNGISKFDRKSQCSLSVKPLINGPNLRSPISDDASTDVMSVHDYHSNKSSPKRLKVLCEAQPVNRDESLIPSPQLAKVLPFRYRQPRIPFSKCFSSTINSHSSHEETQHTNTETFQRILENKTVFKKHLSTVSSVVKTVAKLKSQSKVNRRASKRLCKVVKSQQKTISINDEVMNGTLISSNQNRKTRSKSKTRENDLQQPLREKRMASLNAAAIINCVQSLFNDGRKGSKSRNELESEDEEITLELDSDVERIDQISLDGNTCITVKKECLITTEGSEVAQLKKERSERCEKGVCNDDLIKKEPLSHTVDKISEYESSIEYLSNKRIKRGVGRPRKTDEQSYLRKVTKYGNLSKKDRGTLGEASWQWDGSGQERAIQLQLDGATVRRRCYPAIRHAKDDIVVSVMDCVMVRSVDQAEEPYLAKVTAFFDDVGGDGSIRKMMTLLWYYRPEHTEQGRLSWHTDDDVYASKHLDTNGLECIEDKAFVLTPELYGRFMSDLKRRQYSSTALGLTERLVPLATDDVDQSEEDSERSRLASMAEPSMDMFVSGLYHSPNFQASFPAEMAASNVFVCRGLYDIKQHKVIKSIVPLMQSPVREPPDRCASFDSAMSLSSCNSRLDHTPLHSITSVTVTTTTAIIDHDSSLSPHFLAPSTIVTVLPSLPSSTINSLSSSPFLTPVATTNGITVSTASATPKHHTDTP